MDFIQRLDPSQLVLGGVALSFLLSLSSSSPPYNLAIFLFGTYAQEHNDAVQSLQTFTGLLGVSAIFDIIWMIRNERSSFIKFLTVVFILFKIPTFFSFLLVLRQRGARFGGLGSEATTVWSMPGGLTSTARDGYQTVDDETYNHQPPQPRGAPKPVSGNNPTAPGTYEAV